MASINSSDHRLSASKRRLKPPLLLRDYLLDDLSSCSSNGFKAFPRRQSRSSTVRLLLDAEIKRSGFHHKRRLSRTRTTCGTALGYAVQKASTALVNAVKLLPFPSSVKPMSPTIRSKHGIFSRSFSKRLLSRSFWRKPDDQRDFGEIVRRVESDHEPEIGRWRSFAEFLRESLDQPTSDQISSAVAGDDDCISGESSSSFGSSEVVQSSSWSGESEVSNENDAVEDGRETSSEEVVIVSAGESVGAHVGDGSSVNRSNLCTDDNRKECVNEEKEQFSPVSVLECPFEDEDDALSSLSCQEGTNEKLERKSRRFGGLVRLEPVDLEKRIEWYRENDKKQNSNQTHDNTEEEEEEEEEEEKRANHLFAMVKSRMKEPNTQLMCNAADNLLLDFFQEERKETRDAETLVKIGEEWVLGRQEDMFMSWEVREKREVYVKEMERRQKWGCFNVEIDCVAEQLENGFFTSLLHELILDFSSLS